MATVHSPPFKKVILNLEGADKGSAAREHKKKKALFLFTQVYFFISIVYKIYRRNICIAILFVLLF